MNTTALNLHQVGSRYFVSASNAVKIVFLKEAAIHFLKYTGKANWMQMSMPSCWIQVR